MRAFWQDRLKRLETSLRDEALRELRGSLVQMVGAAIWDGINDQLCATNGGLYLCNPLSSTLDQPGGFYSYRDGNQVAFAVVSTFPELARDQLIRNVTTFRHDWGIPQSSCTVAGSIGYRAPGGGHGKCAIASDQVYWFLLALSEYLRTTREFDLLQRSLANAHGETKTLRAHLDDMLRFVDDVVGYGPHGLCRFLSGDWNDYLGNIGSEGRGESFFNVALNIISKERLAWVYEAMGESVAAADLRHQAALLREKAAPYLHGQWFPRAIADDGRIVGGEEDRLYLESQPWLVLARCGSAEARRRALQSAFDHCMTPIGPVIIDRGLVAADWAGITQCRYPLGCGENAGIWWIAGYWLAMALDQEGLTDMADQVYRSCSAENHHRHFPAEWWSPFMSPDGIDGRESPTFGKAQQASGGYNRERNPHEVAKFAYQVWFASHPGRPQVLCW
jgi:cellobiose phosphorylase